MIDALEILILGIIQGLTEFLPISSSGHLVVSQQIFNMQTSSEGGALLEVVLHVGTLIAVIVYYWRDIYNILRFLSFRSGKKEELQSSRSILKYIIIGSVPTALLGIFFKDWFESCFEKPVLVGFALCVTGGMCLITRFIPRGDRPAPELGVYRSMAIGFAQGLAIIPGISRSGTTIVTALCLGVKPKEAGRYSFLLSLPAVGGAALLKLSEYLRDEAAVGLNPVLFILGIVSAALVGLLCLQILTRILKAGNFFYFGFYCVPLGLFVICYFL